jgi:hypothetical protein
MALKQCEECGNTVSNQAERCPHCGIPIKYVNTKTEKQKKWYERSSITLCFAAFIILLGLGFVHIITGITSPLGLPFDIALKDSFGYSETFVNANKITGMPWIAAQSRYPLGCNVLQRKRYIESDAEFKERTKREAQEEFEKAQEQFEGQF